MAAPVASWLGAAPSWPRGRGHAAVGSTASPRGTPEAVPARGGGGSGGDAALGRGSGAVAIETATLAVSQSLSSISNPRAKHLMLIRASLYKSPPPPLFLWRETPESLAPFFTLLGAELRPLRGRPESCITMEAPGPPQPCVRLVEPASPAPPSVAPTPLPEKHEGTVISAAPVRSEAALPPQSHSIDGEGSKVSASVPKKMRVMKKAGDVQPPRAPARSPAAPSTQASANRFLLRPRRRPT